jgi:hypothetical protein
MQRAAGVLDDAVWRRRAAYPRGGEVDQEANAGPPAHPAPIDERTFGLGWARARLAAGTPVVLECYMHRMTRDERRRQIDVVTG